ncbi:MAG: hypothetical protein QOG76_930, partial [Pseudonocardiales bacterium]|nr:hypothetical protein [Pseudonocardiales bacterium]
DLPATESSPLVAGGIVWVGDWDGNVSAFAAPTGRLRWRFHADAPVKSSPALAGGRLYVATYGGHLYALDASTGRQLWRASVQPRLFGRGRFYSTPAVGHGRVYLGSTDGKVYAYGARTGRLRWSFSTGGYVYGSAALVDDLVLIGSYDGRLYALDAATGRPRWSFEAAGRISGSPTIVGNVVYVSTLAERTFALDVRTGRHLWTFPDGKYSAGVADSAHFYLVGYNRLFALAPRAPKENRGTVVPARPLTSPKGPLDRGLLARHNDGIVAPVVRMSALLAQHEPSRVPLSAQHARQNDTAEPGRVESPTARARVRHQRRAATRQSTVGP